MGRQHLLEIIDQSWCPAVVREEAVDVIQFTVRAGNLYRHVVGRLKRALKRTGTNRIIDLGSGTGGPWLRLLPAFEKRGYPIEVMLTDFYPNLEALAQVGAASRGKINFHSESVDAKQIPPELEGFRTMFSSFHHFRPEEGEAILRDAVKNRQGIGIFEFTSQEPLSLLIIFCCAVWIAACTPFIKPFRWSRLLLTYLIPAVPFVCWHDGLVSCLRTYSVKELKALAGKLGDCGYVWDIGRVPAWPSPVPVTYLIGYPDPERS